MASEIGPKGLDASLIVAAAGEAEEAARLLHGAVIGLDAHDETYAASELRKGIRALQRSRDLAEKVSD